MGRLPRRLAVLAAALALGAFAAGCGKSNLSTTTGTTSSTTGTAKAPSQGAAAAGRAGGGAGSGRRAHGNGPAVPVPVPLTSARAAAFAHAVTLTAADVPGAHAVARSRTPASREREAARCGGRSDPTIGEGRSPDLQRGKGLDRESVSSSVEVLRDAKTAERALGTTPTTTGISCYEKVLLHSLRAESDPNIRLLGIKIAPLGMTVDGAGQARGIRILARVGVPGAGVVVPLFVDALSVAYGPAEIDLYATSFVQPVATRTEQELLGLLHERARRQRL